MNQINERDETLMSICVETQGRSEIDPESGDPNENCVFAMLIREGCDGSSLDSADGKVALSMDFLYRVAYPNTDPSQAIDKMQPDSIKLAAIDQKCKFISSETAANNVVNKDGENARNTSFIRAKIGAFELQYKESTLP